jgi:membrane-bound lytic murein transglycosylase F
MAQPHQLIYGDRNADPMALADAIAAGKADYTVIDAAAFPQVQRYREDLAMVRALPEPHPYRFTVRRDSPKLQASLDTFLREEFASDFYAAAERRYFDHDNIFVLRDHPLDRISPFDDLVKEYAERYSFDWRLIVAQMYEESRFRPGAVSEAGARGLMQVLPLTARSLGFRKLDRPDQGIHAGVKYLDVQRDRFEDTIAVADRTWFALAAYHAGFDRVQAARRHARRMGLDANRWFGSVDKAMVALSRQNKKGRGYRAGRVTVEYVRSVRERYETYLQMHPATTVATL